MKQDYLIAGHRIRIEGELLIEAVAQIPGFPTFHTNTEGEPVARFVASDKEFPAFSKTIHSIDVEGVTSNFGYYEDGYAFETIPEGGESLQIRMKKGENTVYFQGNFTMRLLRFGCWMAYGMTTVPLQTVAIHTSCIQYKDKAVIFLGESGTGKSTHTRLWRENIDGAVLLNDDSPIIRIVDGQPWVYGSPWSGKTHCYKDECYPLAACVRLSQAPRNEISKLSNLHAYAALHPSCPPCFAYDEPLYDDICEVLDALLSSVPVYHLACLPNADAAHLSCTNVFGV